ncbi:hypothetical protein GP486_002896 [Trichoglossum hirsutum]|uniref:Uncharacterized protein n=1 Tax=Trichoglossum hirsutum TaxID=265104 RepID=A0A9P8RRN6_9PEZI|nr:hypothetical protein GP486_002896 [Trichoglossum hirsutum]
MHKVQWVFLELVSKGVLTDRPSFPNTRKHRSEGRGLVDILACFKALSGEATQDTCSLNGWDIKDPVEWLGNAIMERSRRPQDVLNAITKYELLGELDDEMYTEYLRRKARDLKAASPYVLYPNLRPSVQSSRV